MKYFVSLHTGDILFSDLFSTYEAEEFVNGLMKRVRSREELPFLEIEVKTQRGVLPLSVLASADHIVNLDTKQLVKARR